MMHMKRKCFFGFGFHDVKFHFVTFDEQNVMIMT